MLYKALVGTRNTLRFLMSHPLGREKPLTAIERFIRWQVGGRISLGATAVPFAGGARLLVEPGMSGATGNVYVGLHECDDMGLLLHFLRPDDLFVDVGANVGSYTVLASMAAGSSSLSLEPVPSTFKRLQDNLRLNDLEKRVESRCVAVGKERGHLYFSVDRDTMNQVVDATYPGVSQLVEVVTLDELLEGRIARAVKIDVEGFENEVLQGGASVLANPELQLLIIESNGEMHDGRTEEAHRKILDAGLIPCSYRARTRHLERLATPRANTGHNNFLYVRDFEFVAERVRSAQQFLVGPWTI